MQESLVVVYACVLLDFNSLNYNYVSKVHLWVRSRQCKGIYIGFADVSTECSSRHLGFV